MSPCGGSGYYLKKKSFCDTPAALYCCYDNVMHTSNNISVPFPLTTPDLGWEVSTKVERVCRHARSRQLPGDLINGF